MGIQIGCGEEQGVVIGPPVDGNLLHGQQELIIGADGIGEGLTAPAKLGDQLAMWALDGRTSRVVNGTARLVDRSRSGTPRQMQPGRCYAFGGVSDEVSLAGLDSVIDIATLWSVTFWFKTAADGQIMEYGKGSSNRNTINMTSTRMQIATYNGTAYAGARTTLSYNDDAWHHFVGVHYANNTALIYIDGALSTPSAIGSGASQTDKNFGGFAGGTGFYDGELFDMRIFDREVTAVEAAQLGAMNQGVASIGPTNPVLWYKGDEGGTTETAYDSSGNGNHGTITAAAVAAFHDATSNDQFSFQNEVGYTERAVAGTLTVEDTAAASWTENLTSLADSIPSPLTGETAYELNNSDTTAAVHRAFEPPGTWANGTGDYLVIYWKSDDVWLFLFSTGAQVGFTTTGVNSVNNNVVELSTKTIGSGWRRTVLYFPQGDRGTFVHQVAIGSNTSTTFTPPNTTDILTFLFYSTTELVDVPTPRDESNTAKDVLNIPLVHVGQAPRDPVLSSPCLTLDGINDFGLLDVTGTDLDFDATDNITMMAWLKDSNAGGDYAVSLPEVSAGNNGVDIGKSATDWTVNVWTHGGGATITGSAITIGEWVHVAITYDGVTAKMYENGVLVTSQAVTSGGGILHATKELNIGRLGTFGGYWDGGIADVQVFRRVLTVAELLAYAASGTQPSDTDLAARYLMSEGAGALAHDVSGNELHVPLTVASEGAAWANQQDKVDTMVKDGVVRATRYLSSSSEAYDTPSVVWGTTWDAGVTVLVWVNTVDVALKVILGTETTRNWTVSLNAGPFMRSQFDGSSGANHQTPFSATNQWKRLGFTWIPNSAASDAHVHYIDGVSNGDRDTIGETDPNLTHAIRVGGWLASLYLDAMLSDIRVYNRQLSAEEVLADFNGTPIESGLELHWPDGGSYEVGRGLAMTPAGTPDAVPVPQGAGAPIGTGPSILQPGQSADLSCGEANSPFAQQLLASALADLTYDRADDEENAIQFARVLAASDSGDDRLLIALPALTGDDLTEIQGYTDE